MTIREVGKRAFDGAADRGFHEPIPREGIVRDSSSLERLALVHSEVSEAAECLRKEGPLSSWIGPDGKPEGYVTELADAVIRICEEAERLSLDLESAINEKLLYNLSRPKRHGKSI